MRRLFLVILLLLCGTLLLVDRTFGSISLHSVLSGSMGKRVPAGSLIVTKAVSPSDYQIGDVAVLPLPTRQGATVTHRLISFEPVAGKRVVRTRGDANPNGDGWTTPVELLKGKVILVIPYLGYPFVWLHSLVGFTVLALCAFCVGVLPLVVSIFARPQGSL